MTTAEAVVIEYILHHLCGEPVDPNIEDSGFTLG